MKVTPVIEKSRRCSSEVVRVLQKSLEPDRELQQQTLSLQKQ